MPHPAGLFSETLDTFINKGFLQYDLVRTYQVFIAEDKGAVTALLSPVVPKIGASLIIPGGRGDEKVWCVSRKPRRVDQGKGAKTKWQVVCRFTNDTSMFERDEKGNPITDPTQIVKKVEFGYQQFSVPRNDVKLLAIEQDGNRLEIPNHLLGHKFILGPVVNSAGVPKFSQKSRNRRTVFVTRRVRTWDDSWHTYENTTNNNPIEIQEFDVDGVRATHRFPANTLRMDIVRKINVWRAGKLYFEARFEMTENTQGWYYREADFGIKRRVEQGLKMPPDGIERYTRDDVKKGPYRPITIPDPETDLRVAIAEPVKLNGAGQEMPTPSDSEYDPKGSIELVYEDYPPKNWGPLRL